MQCYHDWHILLAIVALISLLALGLVVPLVAAALHFKVLRRKVQNLVALYIARGVKKRNLQLIVSHVHQTINASRSLQQFLLLILFHQLRSNNIICLSQLHIAIIAKLEPFSKSISKGFKEQYRWWPVVDMACRYFFIVIVVSTVGNKASFCHL